MGIPLIALVLSLGLAAEVPVWAQHEHHAAPATPPAGPAATAPAPPGDEMPHGAAHETTDELLDLPHGRLASGTAWMPDSTPTYGTMEDSGAWDLSYHGSAHLAYLRMRGARGDTSLDAINWAMAMARRPVGEHGRLQLKGMVSLDPLTVGGAGYPLLLQTGESWGGVPLRDHQHPHNYFSELAAQYSHEFSDTWAVHAYAAAVGEPALGPPTFMHRTQALDNPLAPIGHHWQDATHIAYGVVTLGARTRRWQLEASTFNGREPGESRWQIQSPRFDSLSGRLSWNPSPDWALQCSHGYLHSPEALHAAEDVWRTTASAVYNRPLSRRENLQVAAVWGRNRLAGRDADSFLLEAHYKRDGGWTPYLRYEHVGKNAEELILPGFPDDRVFRVQQLTVGVAKDLPVRGDLQWAVGAQALFSFVPTQLEPTYGGDPVGWMVYLRVHPRRMAH